MQAENQGEQGPQASVSHGGVSFHVSAAASQGRGEPRNGHWTWQDGAEWLQGRGGEVMEANWVGPRWEGRWGSRDGTETPPRRAMGPREG